MRRTLTFKMMNVQVEEKGCVLKLRCLVFFELLKVIDGERVRASNLTD